MRTVRRSLHITIIVTYLLIVQCRIINFDEKVQIDKRNDDKVFNFVHEVGIFARDDLPFHFLFAPIATGDAFVQVNLTGSKGIELLFLPGTIKQRIQSPGGNLYCKNGKLDITEEGSPLMIHRQLDGLRTLEQRLISHTDNYYLFIAYCDSTPGEITFKGSVVFMNPYGHLEGKLFGTWMFYAGLSVAYIVVCIFWIILSCIYRKDFLMLQFCTTLVLGLCTLESVVIYFDYFLNNLYGNRVFIVMSSGILLTITRKVVSRILVLIVCMGYGSVKPSLERRIWYILGVLGILYYIFSCTFEIAQVLREDESISEFTYYVANIPVDVIDIIFYLWIVYSLWYTLQELKLNKQTAKMQLYNRLFIMLVCYLCLSILTVTIQAISLKIGEISTTDWQYHWLFQAVHEILFFLAFLTIIILWRPSRHNKRYLYSEQLTTSDEFMNASDDEQTDIEMMLQEVDSDSDDEDIIPSNKRGKNRLRHVEHSLPTPVTPAHHISDANTSTTTTTTSSYK